VLSKASWQLVVWSLREFLAINPKKRAPIIFNVGMYHCGIDFPSDLVATWYNPHHYWVDNLGNQETCRNQIFKKMP
jgi:hypothetical protein